MPKLHNPKARQDYWTPESYAACMRRLANGAEWAYIALQAASPFVFYRHYTSGMLLCLLLAQFCKSLSYHWHRIADRSEWESEREQLRRAELEARMDAQRLRDELNRPRLFRVGAN